MPDRRKLQMKVLTSSFLLLLLFTATHAVAQSASTSTTSRLEQLRAKGSEALLNLDYDGARQAFREIAHSFPDEPLGPRMLAWTLWLETLNKSRLQQGAIYSSQSFSATRHDKPDQKTAQEFRELTRRAEQLARARLQRNPRDPQTLYEMGSVETLKASFGITAEGRYLAALRGASSGVDRQREVLKLDPNFHDAELTIGLYDYVVGSLPLAPRLVAGFVGARGSKKRGLQTLERVAKQGSWERDNAKLLVMTLYKNQRRFAESLALSRELQHKYPYNYLFKLEAADSLISQAAEERRASRISAADPMQKEAVSIFESLLNERALPRMAERGVVYFRYGEGLLALGQPEQAAREFLATTMMREAESELVTRAHLRAAQSFDLAGRRDDALAQYRIVLNRSDADDLQVQARRGIGAPYKVAK
jgi:hypothetical protein